MTQKPDNPPAMMTNEQLAAAVARVNELDEKCYNDGGLASFALLAMGYREAAAIITQLWDERQNATIKSDNTQALYNALETIQQQRDVLRQVREQLHLCRPEHVTRPLIADLDAVIGDKK